ncbi:hypothetical protein BGZ94_000931 [Podila epigama]|nr:hypothetical protein BGZ94_000931 [Podila epigama]
MLLRTSLAAAVLLQLSSSLVHAQQQEPPSVNILYSNELSVEIATEIAPFNTCFPSKAATNPYNFLTFTPYDATINFFTDNNCQTFAFGLNGHYSDHPGIKAGSFEWVGRSKDTLGLLAKAPFQSEKSSQPPSPPAPAPVPVPVPGKDEGEKNTGNDNSGGSKDKQDQGSGGKGDDSTTSTSGSSMFFGGLAGGAMFLSIGGLVFWKTRGKKKPMLDKGKGVLPYSRVADGREGERDEDILLPNRGRGGDDHGSFAIEDEDEDDDDEHDMDEHKDRLRLEHTLSHGSYSSSSSSGSGSRSIASGSGSGCGSTNHFHEHVGTKERYDGQ